MKAELCANCIQHGNECNKAVAEKLLAEARLQDAADEVRRLRQRHAAAVEAAYREGFNEDLMGPPDPLETDAAWLASEAKARLT